jgi:hypothetical protein
MTSRHYSIARAKAGRWKGQAVPRRFAVSRGIPDDLPASRTAIYVAELGDGHVAYVGQTRQGTRARLLQHARRWERNTCWAYVWVVPLIDTVPAKELNRIEGRIGRLLRPRETVRLPRPH